MIKWKINKNILLGISLFIFFFLLAKCFKVRKENFENKLSPNSVGRGDLINQMFNPFANFIDIGDTKNTNFRGYNAPISDPKPLDYIKLNLDKTIVINNISYKDIKPILKDIEKKEKSDLTKLLNLGFSPEYFEKNNYIQNISNLQIADSNKNTYLYPLNYTTSHQNIYKTIKSKLPQFDNGINFLLFLFIEYFRLKFKDNFKYISILRYKVYEGKIDRNLNYYYRAQADFFINENFTIWSIEFDIFMIKINNDNTKKLFDNLKKNIKKDEYKIKKLINNNYYPLILSCKCVGNYFQDQLFLTQGYSHFDYNYGKYAGDTIDDPFEHDFILADEGLKAKQFKGLDENFSNPVLNKERFDNEPVLNKESFESGSIPIEAPNVGNLDKTFNNLQNPRPYSKKNYITQIVNNQDQSRLTNQYACFEVDTGNIVFDIYSFKQCDRDYDDYFRKKPRGIFDKACTKDDECPFYNQNINYPNNRGGCKDGFCELPAGLLKLGYKHYLSKTKPLCYNCFTKDWLPISNLHDCCEEQNDREKYPFLKGPDYAFKDDLANRTNYYNKINCKYYPNKTGDRINNTVCKKGKFFYNI